MYDDLMVKSSVVVHLVLGDDPYLSGAEVEKILSESDEIAREEFGATSEVGEILQALNTPSMLSDRRFVVLRDVEGLPAESQRLLTGYLQNPSPGVTLVMVGTKASPKLLAAVKTAGRVSEVGKGKRTDLFTWVKKEASSRGIKLMGDASGALIEAVGEERLALSNALEEISLAMPGKAVGPDEVRSQFRTAGQTKIFGFIDAVASRQAGPALDALHRLLRRGEAPQLIFWSLTRHFRMLLATEGSPQSVAKDLGIPPWRAEKLIRQARNFSHQSLVEAYQMLAEGDRKIKSSEEPETLTLERAVVSIAGGSS